MSELDSVNIAPVAQDPDPPVPSDVKRFTTLDIAWMVKLRDEGHTLAQIAQRLDCSTSAVHKHLSLFTDRRDLARQYLEGSSLRMARNVVRKGRASDHVATLKGIGVLAPDASAQVAVVIGPATSTPTLDVPSFDVGRPTLDAKPTD